MIKKDLPVVCSSFSETCLKTGPFLHFPLVCLVFWFFFNCPFLNRKVHRRQNDKMFTNIDRCKIQTQMRQDIKMGETNWLVFRYSTAILTKQHAYGIAAPRHSMTRLRIPEFS